jgi:putative ABC transport system substrate-binding protein
VFAPAARSIGWAPALLCLLLWGAPDRAGAAEVAILKSADLAAYSQAVTGFKAALPPSTTFVEYDMQGDIARGQKLAGKIRASEASLLLAVGTKAALVARREISDIPVIFCMVLDPSKHDLKAPNMTGVRMEIPVTRQFNALRSVLPAVRRLGVLYDPDKTGSLVEDARFQARALGIEVVARPVRSEKDVAVTLRALLPEVEALWLVPDGTVVSEDSLKFVLSVTLDSNLPVIGFSSELVRNGVLIGLSVSYEDIGRQAGLLARKILSDQYRPFSTTFPPDRFRLALNLKTAKFLGIAISQEVMNSADELY